MIFCIRGLIHLHALALLGLLRMAEWMHAATSRLVGWISRQRGRVIR